MSTIIFLEACPWHCISHAFVYGFVVSIFKQDGQQGRHPVHWCPVWVANILYIRDMVILDHLTIEMWCPRYGIHNWAGGSSRGPTVSLYQISAPVWSYLSVTWLSNISGASIRNAHLLGGEGGDLQIVHSAFTVVVFMPLFLDHCKLQVSIKVISAFCFKTFLNASLTVAVTFSGLV